MKFNFISSVSLLFFSPSLSLFEPGNLRNHIAQTMLQMIRRRRDLPTLETKRQYKLDDVRRYRLGGLKWKNRRRIVNLTHRGHTSGCGESVQSWCASFNIKMLSVQPCGMLQQFFSKNFLSNEWYLLSV